MLLPLDLLHYAKINENNVDALLDYLGGGPVETTNRNRRVRDTLQCLYDRPAVNVAAYATWSKTFYKEVRGKTGAGGPLHKNIDEATIIRRLERALVVVAEAWQRARRKRTKGHGEGWYYLEVTKSADTEGDAKYQLVIKPERKQTDRFRKRFKLEPPVQLKSLVDFNTKNPFVDSRARVRA